MARVQPLVAIGVAFAAFPAAARAEVVLGAGGGVEWTYPTGVLWAGAELWPADTWLAPRAEVMRLPGRVLVEGALAMRAGDSRPDLFASFHVGGGAEVRGPYAAVSAGGTLRFRVAGAAIGGLEYAIGMIFEGRPRLLVTTTLFVGFSL